MRENALCALAAGGASLAMGWLGLYGYAWNDYEQEVLPSFNALTHGHVLEFLRLAPAYGGSLIERAPFALLPGLWGGGQLAVYRMVAVPCLLAGAALGVWLCARMRTAGMSRLWRGAALGVCVANPMTLQALELGHPEELLGACLCVAAVLLAARGRPIWAGVLLGLAIANKEWALLVAGPVLLALPAGTGKSSDARTSSGVSACRDATRSFSATWPSVVGAGGSRQREAIRCLMCAGIVTAIILAPLMLVSGGGFATSTRVVATASGSLFQPWQVWWFFGWHGSMVHGIFGFPLPGYRHGPAWVGVVSHPSVIVVGFALAGALWLLQRRGTNVGRSDYRRDALLLLALVLLGRCLLDAWNTGYYMLPFSLAALTWEIIGEKRAPILTSLGVVAPWLALAQLSARWISPDVQAALFLAWTLPLAGYLALRLYAPGLQTGAGIRARVRAHARQEITVSSVGSPVSTS